MASAVDVCNTALAHLGAEMLIASIDPPDGSAEAGWCATFYPIARRVALESAQWTFAKARATLAQVANPSAVWKYAYALPSDHINPVRILNLASYNAAVTMLSDSYLYAPGSAIWWTQFQRITEDSSANYAIEDQTVLTDEPDAVMIYLRDVTDTSKWSPSFTTGVAQLLAGYLAGPIIKGVEGMRIGQAWTQSGLAALGRSAASDANSTSERADFIPQSIQARA